MSDVIKQLSAGSLAGFVATGPMTLVMEGLREATDDPEPIAPRVIAERALQTAGVRDELPEPARVAATGISHFGYGATAGAPFGVMAEAMNVPPVRGGIAYGLGVWALGYFGWLPATGLYRSPLREPAHRNARIIAAHVVWGATLGLLTGLMLKGRERRGVVI